MSVLPVLCGAVAGGGVNTSFAARIRNTSASTPGTRSASVTFYSDGTASTIPSTAPPNWFFPTTVGIGAGWSVRVTGTGTGTNVSGMVSGVWYPLTSPRVVAYSNSNPNDEGYGAASVDFSPDGGTTVINSGSIDWDVGYLV